MSDDFVTLGGLEEHLRQRLYGMDMLVTSVEAENAKLRTTLQASTELLRKSLPWNPENRKLIKNQIAANEAVLGDNNGTDQK